MNRNGKLFDQLNMKTSSIHVVAIITMCSPVATITNSKKIAIKSRNKKLEMKATRFGFGFSSNI